MISILLTVLGAALDKLLAPFLAYRAGKSSQIAKQKENELEQIKAKVKGANYARLNIDDRVRDKYDRDRH